MNMKTTSYLSVLATALFIATQPASAQVFTWDTTGQPGGGDWNTGANWGGTAPNVNTANATIGTLTAASAVNLSAPATVNSLALTSANNMSLTGSTLTFGGATSGTTVLTSSDAGNKTISAPLVISNANATITTSVGSGSLNLGNVNYSAASGFLFLLPGNGTAINVTGNVTNPTRGLTIGNSTASTGAVTLSGTNSYVGTTVLNSTQLNINSTTALGSSTFFLGSGSIIDNTSGAAITLANNNAISVRAASGFTFVGSNNLNLGTGNLELFSNSANNTYTFAVNGSTLTFGGNVTSGGTGLNNLGITKSGNGTLVLAGNISLPNETTTKMLTINAGTVTLSGNNSASAGGVTMNTNTTLNINNANALGSGTLDITGGILNNTSGSSVTVAGNNAQVWRGSGLTFTGSNALNLGTGAVSLGVTVSPVTRTISVGGSGATGVLTVGGVISDGGAFAGGITKAGAGTLILSGNNTYTGSTAVVGGTLLVNNTLGSGTGAGTVSVNSNATLGGTGAISGSTTIGGIASPGLVGSIGTLTFGSNVTWNGGGSAGAPTDWVFQLGVFDTSDMLAINGDFVKGTGSVFRFDLAGSTAAGTFKLIDVAGVTTGFSAGDFTYTNYSGSFTPTFSIIDNDVYLNVVPEPSTLALLALSLSAVLAVRRRRQ